MKTFEMSYNEGVQKVMNKVVLFIVEGALDREFFGYYFSELIENKNLEIYVTNGDILTKFTRNPERLIEKHFNSALKKSKFLKGDIERIVHICDIDGSCFDEHQIKISPERDYSLKNYEYNPFFHHNDEDEFLKQKERDILKKDHAYRFKYRFLEFNYKQLKYMILEQFENMIIEKIKVLAVN